jgi:low affinity Fe/Cu permease
VKAWFEAFARRAALLAGSPPAFILALAVVLAWFVAGFFVGFTDTTQLVINTGTTIVTFLMVFLVQASQNRDTAELKAMLRELVEDLPEVDERKAAARAREEL